MVVIIMNINYQVLWLSVRRACLIFTRLVVPASACLVAIWFIMHHILGPLHTATNALLFTQSQTSNVSINATEPRTGRGIVGWYSLCSGRRSMAANITNRSTTIIREIEHKRFIITRNELLHSIESIKWRYTQTHILGATPFGAYFAIGRNHQSQTHPRISRGGEFCDICRCWKGEGAAAINDSRTPIRTEADGSA